MMLGSNTMQSHAQHFFRRISKAGVARVADPEEVAEPVLLRVEASADAAEEPCCGVASSPSRNAASNNSRSSSMLCPRGPGAAPELGQGCRTRRALLWLGRQPGHWASQATYRRFRFCQPTNRWLTRTRHTGLLANAWFARRRATLQCAGHRCAQCARRSAACHAIMPPHTHTLYARHTRHPI